MNKIEKCEFAVHVDGQEFDINIEYEYNSEISEIVLTYAWKTLKDKNNNEVVVDILPVFDIILDYDIYNIETEILKVHIP